MSAAISTAKRYTYSSSLAIKRVLEPIERVSEILFGLIIPVVIPFLFMHDARRALHISNAIAIFMLFLSGYVFGRTSGRGPWATGILMVMVGSIS